LNRYTKLVGLFSALLLSVQLGAPFTSFAQTTTPEYFPETGHTVRPPFIDFFQKTGGVTQHGFPITEDYVDPQTGLLVQYFEKSRLEWHPGNPAAYRVQLGLLGEQLGKRQPRIPISQVPAPNDPNCEHAQATGHNICHAFRDYYHRNGGLDRFGYPISGYDIVDGYTVQYFQRARMEWHPERPSGQQVQLGPLGHIYYAYAGLDSNRLRPVVPPGVSRGPVPSLAVRGSVVNSVAVSNGLQTAFVFTTDQYGRPMGNAAVSLVIHYPHGDEVLVLPPTSAAGVSFRTFTVAPTMAGTIVSMEFIVGYNGIVGESLASFLVWY
jgi:hypothetical protein